MTDNLQVVTITESGGGAVVPDPRPLVVQAVQMQPLGIERVMPIVIESPQIQIVVIDRSD